MGTQALFIVRNFALKISHSILLSQLSKSNFGQWISLVNKFESNLFSELREKVLYWALH
jgi:hypothetical protein